MVYKSTHKQIPDFEKCTGETEQETIIDECDGVGNFVGFAVGFNVTGVFVGILEPSATFNILNISTNSNTFWVRIRISKVTYGYKPVFCLCRF